MGPCWAYVAVPRQIYTVYLQEKRSIFNMLNLCLANTEPLSKTCPVSKVHHHIKLSIHGIQRIVFISVHRRQYHHGSTCVMTKLTFPPNKIRQLSILRIQGLANIRDTQHILNMISALTGKIYVLHFVCFKLQISKIITVNMNECFSLHA